MTKRVLGFLSAVMLFFASAGYSLEIFYPADHSFVTKSNYLIIKGGGDLDLDGFVIELNEYRSDFISTSTDAYIATFGDMLVVEPMFDVGKNRVKVEGYRDGKIVAQTNAEIFYQASPFDEPPKGFTKFAMHVEENEEKCVGCHSMNPGANELKYTDAERNPCASCHARMLNKKHVHGPAGVFDCLSCHDAESRPEKFQPRNGDALVCIECHTDKSAAEQPFKYTHGPFEAGMCLVCHDPHASDFLAQSPKAITQLCLDCHANFNASSHVLGTASVSGKSHPFEGPSNPANPSQEFNCVSCHDPHGGNAQSYLVNGIGSRMALCSICHKK